VKRRQATDAVIGGLLVTIFVMFAVVYSHYHDDTPTLPVQQLGTQPAPNPAPSPTLSEEQFAQVAPLLFAEHRPAKASGRRAIETLALRQPTLTRISILDLPPGEQFSVQCDGVTAECVTASDGACVAMLELPGRPPHSCKWGREGDGWVSFLWSRITIEDSGKRRAVR
jgi:hypothetical protein